MIEFEKVSKVYSAADVEAIAADDVPFQIDPGEFVAIVGPSGCGKLTLLKALGLLNNAPGVAYALFGEHVAPYQQAGFDGAPTRADQLRVSELHLLDDPRVVEHFVAAPIDRGVSAAHERRVAKALGHVGVAYCARRRPRQVSGGQHRRVAVAVAQCTMRPPGGRLVAEILLAAGGGQRHFPQLPLPDHRPGGSARCHRLAP